VRHSARARPPRSTSATTPSPSATWRSSSCPPALFNDPERGKLYRKLFVTEASLAGKLQHPHICQIYDAVADDALHYIVMEYVDGGTLEKFCTPEHLLPSDKAVEIVFKCTRALEFAHKMGITHRDIKPANMLYTGETDVKVTDFGAALISSGDSTQISAIGSPAYMSPQQVKEHPLDHRTDIYSMGVVMYHLLAGRLPFQASNNFSLIYQITNVEPPPPSSFRPESRRRSTHRAPRDGAGPGAALRGVGGFLRSTSPQVFRGEAAAQRRARRSSSRTPTSSRRCAKLPFFENSRTPKSGRWRASRPGASASGRAAHEGRRARRLFLHPRRRPGQGDQAQQAAERAAPANASARWPTCRRRPARGADVTRDDRAKIISVPTDKLELASDACRHNSTAPSWKSSSSGSPWRTSAVRRLSERRAASVRQRTGKFDFWGKLHLAHESKCSAHKSKACSPSRLRSSPASRRTRSPRAMRKLPRDAKLNAAARLISGLPCRPPRNTRLRGPRVEGTQRIHARGLGAAERQAGRCDDRLAHTRALAAAARTARTLMYPFSGPDFFICAYWLFPGCENPS
jgi:serine/threonine protein kinase